MLVYRGEKFHTKFLLEPCPAATSVHGQSSVFSLWYELYKRTVKTINKNKTHKIQKEKSEQQQWEQQTSPFFCWQFGWYCTSEWNYLQTHGLSPWCVSVQGWSPWGRSGVWGRCQDAPPTCAWCGGTWTNRAMFTWPSSPATSRPRRLPPNRMQRSLSRSVLPLCRATWRQQTWSGLRSERGASEALYFCRQVICFEKLLEYRIRYLDVLSW